MTQIDNSDNSRKYKLFPEDVLRGNGIEVRGAARYYTTCPRCSAKRKPIHQKTRCLGVTRPDEMRVYWGCNHCGWTGPGVSSNPMSRPHEERSKNDGPALFFPASTRTLYNYSKTLRKVKLMWPDGCKKFWWEHIRKGWWVKGTGGLETHLMLYRLITAKKMALALKLPICVVEGEKDVECLMGKGIPATCNAHGASELGKEPKWRQHHSDQLTDFNVVVMNDADQAGMAHAKAVRDLSYRRARSLQVLDQATHFPGHKDISDWFKSGGDKQTLLDFIEGAPEYDK